MKVMSNLYLSNMIIEETKKYLKENEMVLKKATIEFGQFLDYIDKNMWSWMSSGEDETSKEMVQKQAENLKFAVSDFFSTLQKHVNSQIAPEEEKPEPPTIGGEAPLTEFIMPSVLELIKSKKMTPEQIVRKMEKKARKWHKLASKRRDDGRKEASEYAMNKARDLFKQIDAMKRKYGIPIV